MPRSEPFGIPPVVVSPMTSQQIRKQFQEILFGMEGDPDGKKILEEFNIDRFVKPPRGALRFVLGDESFTEC